MSDASTDTATVIRDDRLIADRWTELDDETAIPAGAGPLVVTLARWRAERDALLAVGAPVGVRLANTEDVDDIFTEIADRPLLVLGFPKHDDGRALTQAKLLRGRLGYRGDVRVDGHILQDLVSVARRCGCNEIKPRADQELQGCLRALGEFSTAYQPAADGIVSVFVRRRGKALQTGN
jgi:uncharacterized protein (DUF934 family)